MKLLIKLRIFDKLRNLIRHQRVVQKNMNLNAIMWTFNSILTQDGESGYLYEERKG
jgi:hypothetical protein